MLPRNLSITLALVALSTAQIFSNLTVSASLSGTTAAPLFTNFTAATSNGIASNATSTALEGNPGSSCNAQLISYSLASREYFTSHAYLTSKISTQYYTSTVYSHRSYNCSKPCGTTLGAISYCGSVTMNISTTNTYSEYMATYWTNTVYPTPSPNCTIGDSDCLSLRKSYDSYFDSFWAVPESNRVTMTSPVRPSCSASLPCTSTSCAFQYAGINLYYWPVTTSVSRDLCAWDPIGGVATTYVPDINNTWTPTTTGPYGVVDGVTMYEGNVYLSVEEPRVLDNCNNEVKRRRPGHNIITIASSALYSVRKYPHNLLPFSVNYDDFNEPTPWSAYVGDRYCANNRPLCSEVFPHDYHPIMIMPPQIRDLDPNWKSCSFNQYGFYDPPIAVQSVGNFLPSSVNPRPTPSTSPEPVHEHPQPGQSGTDGGAIVTPAPPKPTSDPPSKSQEPPDPNPPNSAQDPGNSIPSSNPNPGNNPAPGPNPAPNPNPQPTPNAPSNPSPPVITIGPSVIPVGPSGGLVIDPGTTLSRGGPPVVISSSTFSIGDGGLTVISPTTSTNIPFGNAPITVPLGPGGSPLVLDPAGSIVVSPGTTLRPGDPAITIGGSTLSIGPSGIVVIGHEGSSSTIPIPGAPVQVLPFGSTAFTLTNGELIIGPGTTIGFGDPAVTISGGIIVSVGTAGVVVAGPSGTSTIPFSTPLPSQVITVGKSTYTMYSGELVLGPGTTIGVGDPAVTISGTTFSVGPTGVVVLSDGGGTTVSVTTTVAGTGSVSRSGNPTATAKTGAGVNKESRMLWVLGLILGLIALG
ncbi:hypothetical protein BCR34DRAFT_601429 [Clohesyomyces aquaticus]|uniref:Uncharacterized protein n=1 Tax=Clohesyomyces aquaticus TaxID=1231657 RepID=A0A1Y1ZMA5_9PLEO|nr:hypothetical protein BCR34DRAFT_601429 [Clohesyomyces aquaticus]